MRLNCVEFECKQAEVTACNLQREVSEDTDGCLTVQNLAGATTRFEIHSWPKFANHSHLIAQ